MGDKLNVPNINSGTPVQHDMCDAIPNVLKGTPTKVEVKRHFQRSGNMCCNPGCPISMPDPHQKSRKGVTPVHDSHVDRMVGILLRYTHVKSGGTECTCGHHEGCHCDKWSAEMQTESWQKTHCCYGTAGRTGGGQARGIDKPWRDNMSHSPGRGHCPEPKNCTNTCSDHGRGAHGNYNSLRDCKCLLVPSPIVLEVPRDNGNLVISPWQM